MCIRDRYNTHHNLYNKFKGKTVHIICKILWCSCTEKRWMPPFMFPCLFVSELHMKEVERQTDRGVRYVCGLLERSHENIPARTDELMEFTAYRTNTCCLWLACSWSLAHMLWEALLAVVVVDIGWFIARSSLPLSSQLLLVHARQLLRSIYVSFRKFLLATNKTVRQNRQATTS